MWPSEVTMFSQPARHVFGLLSLSLSLSVVLYACAEETPPRATTTTTGAVSQYDWAATQIAEARCRRAAECNRVEQMYGNPQTCMNTERSYAQQVVAGCASGINRNKLDNCLGALQRQECQADLGPVSAGCDSYCSK
jgi:hypothetical protein